MIPEQQKLNKAALTRLPSGGFSVTFRHPIVKDRTGTGGLRTRVKTTHSETEAQRLLSDANQLLAEPSFWESSSRDLALRRFLPSVVDAFYREMAPSPVDSMQLRHDLLPLPDKASEYKTVLLLGTTGSGKTTLLRQLLGTHPIRERFPATSAGRTTVAPTEIYLADGEFEAAVTFLPQYQVREHVEECVSNAVIAALRGESDDQVLYRVLHHVEQRFRLAHILGLGKLADANDVEEEQSLEFEGEAAIEFLPPSDTWSSEANEVLDDVVISVGQLASKLASEVKKEVQESTSNERVIEDSFEDDLGHKLSKDDTFASIVDQLMDQVEKRFELLAEGELKRSLQGWPLAWRWKTSDRRALLRSVSRFSSNHWRNFGQLLTPLVNGLRVKGPFRPEWATQLPHLVLIDGEGLGHTQETVASVPAAVAELVQSVDRVCLVDNATQPMQAAPIAVLRHLVASGNAEKLMLGFTHFDLVKADNLRSIEARRLHVLASVEGGLIALKEQLGPFAEKTIRPSVESSSFFLASLDRVLRPELASERRTIEELKRLLTLAQLPPPKRYEGPMRPVYDLPTVALHVHSAAGKFNDLWRARLGRQSLSPEKKEHWARIKALTRRLSEGDDAYLHLRPASDLHSELHQEIYQALQKPTSWDGGLPDETQKHRVVAPFANAISHQLLDLCRQRVLAERRADWKKAHEQTGRGSSYVRAAIIDDEINKVAAPVPSSAPSANGEQFLNKVMAVVREAAIECGVRLQ